MRHLKSGRHLNRDHNARKALMRNLCTSLLEHGRITTTEAKAKELRRWVDRLITEAKADDVAARRRVARDISRADVADKLFTNLMPRLRQQTDRDPTFPIQNAVRGMLQNNTLGGQMLKRLRVYAGPEHEHQAQTPRRITFNEKGDINVV